MSVYRFFLSVPIYKKECLEWVSLVLKKERRGVSRDTSCNQIAKQREHRKYLAIHCNALSAFRKERLGDCLRLEVVDS